MKWLFNNNRKYIRKYHNFSYIRIWGSRPTRMPFIGVHLHYTTSPIARSFNGGYFVAHHHLLFCLLRIFAWKCRKLDNAVLIAEQTLLYIHTCIHTHVCTYIHVYDCSCSSTIAFVLSVRAVQFASFNLSLTPTLTWIVAKYVIWQNFAE